MQSLGQKNYANPLHLRKGKGVEIMWEQGRKKNSHGSNDLTTDLLKYAYNCP